MTTAQDRKAPGETLLTSAFCEFSRALLAHVTAVEPPAVGRSLAASTGVLLSESSGSELSTALRTRTTAFELANAITSTARERSDVTARLNMESLGHRYLVSKTS